MIFLNIFRLLIITLILTIVTKVRILLVTATDAEAEIMQRLNIPRDPEGKYIIGDSSVRVLVTGVGTVATAWALTKWFSSDSRPDLSINAGIAGSFREELAPGDVVMPVSDCFADAGIETGKGFLTLAEAGLEHPDTFPFKGGRIIAENKYVQKTSAKIKPVSSITVNTASGKDETIKRLISKYDPDIETMEGAAFFYICSKEKVPFMGIRAISNRVESRNRYRWNIPLALDNLAAVLQEVIFTLD